MSNKIAPLGVKAKALIKKDPAKSYIISILTLFLTQSFINPIYLISTVSFLI